MNYILISGSLRKLELNKKIIEFLKSQNLNNKKICFIAASFNEYTDNDHYVNKLIKLFSNQKFEFEKFYIIDNRMLKKT